MSDFLKEPYLLLSNLMGDRSKKRHWQINLLYSWPVIFLSIFIGWRSKSSWLEERFCFSQTKEGRNRRIWKRRPGELLKPFWLEFITYFFMNLVIVYVNKLKCVKRFVSQGKSWREVLGNPPPRSQLKEWIQFQKKKWAWQAKQKVHTR